MDQPLNIHYFRHAAFEGLGSIESWIKENNHHLSCTRFYEDALLPDIEKVDWLIAIGGPMGVNDEDQFPWLKAEKRFIEQAINKGKTVIGICLGSQLIADVAGAKVYPGKQKEIGWFPVQLTYPGKNNRVLKDIPEEFNVFHWHGDTFDLPKGAIHLAKSDICENQAFLLNDRVLALQFHPEATEESIAGMLLHCSSDLVPSNSVQTAEKISTTKEFIKENNERVFQILNKLATQ